MFDIKIIRENPDYVKERLAARQTNYDTEIDRALELDSLRRDIIYRFEQLKARQNAANKQIPIIKKTGGDVESVFSMMKELSEQAKAYDQQLKEVQSELDFVLLRLPNIPAPAVSTGKDSSENPVIRTWGTPRNFKFEPRAHWDIGNDLDILDPARAGKVAGARFHFYKGYGAALERAVINYFLDIHTKKNGYTEILPPFLANRDAMTGTGQLPKFADDMFHIENTDYFLIPTAEVPVTNLHRDEILDLSELPRKYVSYSACFRAEAGSAGRDTRGLIRQHQFNKVELVKFTTPETSYDELENLTADAESVLQGLELPYRVVRLCTGDLGFSSAMTYDIEVWMPSYGRYVEISSCSNYEDFQARRAGIRYKDKRNKADKTRLVHTLNGSGVAVGRAVACILESYQKEDGSVSVPKALCKYMDSAEITRPK